MNDMKNTLESLRNRADQTEERISNLEDRNLEMTQEWELRFLKSEESLGELSDMMRKTNIRIIGLPKGEESRECI